MWVGGIHLPRPAWGLRFRFLITVLMSGSLLPCPTPWKERINQTAQDPAADVTMQPCSPRFSSALRAVSWLVTGRRRVDAVLGAGHLGRYTGLDLTNQPSRASLTHLLSLLRLYLITGRTQPSPPSWRKWIFSCCLWPILMDMYTRTLK